MANSDWQNRSWKSFGEAGDNSGPKNWKSFGSPNDKPDEGGNDGDSSNENSNTNQNTNENSNHNENSNQNENSNHNDLTNFNHFTNDNHNSNSNTNTTGNNTNTNSSGSNNATNEANNTNTATAENNSNVNVDVNVVSVSNGGGNNGGGNGGGNNGEPVAQDDDFTLSFGQTFLTGNVLSDNGNGIDSDPDGDTLSVTPGSFTTANGGTAIVMADGTFFYIPPANNTANDSFTYTLLDSNGGDDTGTVNIARLVANNNPIAQDDNFTKFLGQTVVSGNVLLDNGNGVDSDPDGDTLSVTPGTFATTNAGSVVLAADGSFTYTPPTSTNAPDTFTYTLNDGNGGTDTATVTIATVSIQNVAPVAQDDEFEKNNAQSGDVITGNVLLDNGNGVDSDANGDTLSVVPQNITTALGNTFVLLANGDFTYTVNSASTSAEQLNYELQDGRGGTDTGTVTVALKTAPGNFVPIAQDDLFATIKNTPLTTGNLLADNGNGADTDPNGDPLTVSPSVINTAQGGIVTVLANGNFVYVPPSNFVGNDTFAYILSDGNGGQDTAIATVNVNTAGNLAPTGGDVVAQISPGILQNTVIVDLPDTDPDGDIITYEITGGNADGLFAVDPAEGRITLAPGKVIDFNTPQDHVLEVTVSDGKGGFGTFNVTIVEQNQVDGSPTVSDVIDGLGGDDELTGDGPLIVTDPITPQILSDDTIESGSDFITIDRVVGDAIQLTGTALGGSVTAGNDILTNNGGGSDRTVGDFEVISLLSGQANITLGNDMITGGEDSEEIFGDIIDGNMGSNFNTLVTFGDDIINGKGGDDDLYGDFEAITSTGGQIIRGKDTFVFEPGSGNDTIFDFRQGDDRLDLSAYGFTATTDFVVTVNATDTVITLDADNSITLKNFIGPLALGDFILAPIALPITSSAPFALSTQAGESWEGQANGNNNSSGESNEQSNSTSEDNSVTDVNTSSTSQEGDTGGSSADPEEQAQNALDQALQTLDEAVGSAGFNDLFNQLGIFDLINDAIDGFENGNSNTGNGSSGSNGSSSQGQSSEGTSSEGTSSDGQSSNGGDGQSSDGQAGGNGTSSDGADGGTGQDGTGADASANGQDGSDGQDSSSSSNGQDGQDGTPGEDASANGQDGTDASSNGQDGTDASSSSDGQDSSSSSNGEDGGNGQDGTSGNGQDSSSSSDGQDGGNGMDGGNGTDGSDSSNNGGSGSMSQTILNGDEMDNVLTGNDLVNIINGFGGDDTIDGSTAGDILTGGAGNDTFVFTQGSGRDIITDFTKGEDTIDVTDYGFSAFGDIDIFTDGFNSIVTLDGTENQITVLGEANLTLDDFAL